MLVKLSLHPACGPHPCAVSRPQLSALTNLRSLHEGLCEIMESGFEALRVLPALQELMLCFSTELPACLSSLASLESLTILNNSDLDALAAALPSLSLTQLALHCSAPAILTALTSQTRLRVLRCWQPAAGWKHPGLVGGEWLRGPSRLDLSAELMMASMPALAHITRLQTANVSDIEDSVQSQGLVHADFRVRLLNLPTLDFDLGLISDLLTC